MTSRWSHNLFKGRIGEAVIEAVLVEFSYLVKRGGYEQERTDFPRYAPDLIVEYPPTGSKEFVEVKYRAARPTSVELDRQRILEYREHYPTTILAISAAWNGAIYCSRVEDLPIDVSDTKEIITLSLLDGYWRHISEFFPIIQKGDRLGRLWMELRDSLGSFGNHSIRGRGVEKIWEDEHRSLAEYLSASWTEDLLGLGIEEPQTEKMTIEELWEKVRHINAVELVEELVEIAEGTSFDSPMMHLAVQRALGGQGENQMVFNIGALIDEIRPHWESLGLDEEQQSIAENFFANIFMGFFKGMTKPAEPRHRDLAERFFDLLPDGFGETFFLDPAIPIEKSERFDLKTVAKLMGSPCRLNA